MSYTRLFFAPWVVYIRIEFINWLFAALWLCHKPFNRGALHMSSTQLCFLLAWCSHLLHRNLIKATLWSLLTWHVFHNSVDHFATLCAQSLSFLLSITGAVGYAQSYIFRAWSLYFWLPCSWYLFFWHSLRSDVWRFCQQLHAGLQRCYWALQASTHSHKAHRW